MPLAVVSLVIQGIAIVHVIRTGREMWWILLILLLPGIGVLIYFVVEVLPSINQSMTARRAGRRLYSAVDPGRGVRQATLEHERNPSVETASRLANELTRAGRFDEAVRIADDARAGLFENDPKLLLSLADAQFAAGRHADTIATLDRLFETNPGFHSPHAHLLYARSLEESGDTARALEEYAAVAEYFPGAEARVRQAMLYKKLGRADEAAELFAAVLKDASLAPGHVRKSQREWLALAKRESAELPAGGRQA